MAIYPQNEVRLHRADIVNLMLEIEGKLESIMRATERQPAIEEVEQSIRDVREKLKQQY